MHIQRIRVPDFRVLKDVDITFEKDFFPRIFPIGSLNGGGKSTLLQLIFVLLHCPYHSERLPFLKNMLLEVGELTESQEKLLAVIDIFDEKQGNISLEFVLWLETYFKHIIRGINTLPLQKVNADDLGLDDFERYSEIKKAILKSKQKIQELEKKHQNILTEEMPVAGIESPEELSRKLSNIIDSEKKTLESYQTKFDLMTQGIELLQNRSLIYLCYVLPKSKSNEKLVLLCRTQNLVRNEVESFWERVSKKIFLAAPSTQVFLFLPRDSRKMLFKTKDKMSHNSYSSQLDQAKSNLPGLFPYDFFAVNLIVDALRDAHDKDFQQKKETGSYGEHYQTLLDELNPMLGNKTINLDSDLSGVTFKLEQNGENIELYPEDLSHGELKRLSMYLWLKFKNIENSIVLIDEIEIALHPDWQYQIVRDLEEWGQSNQYILATHSYELCQALTPAHVKELEPKLIQPKPEKLSSNS